MSRCRGCARLAMRFNDIHLDPQSLRDTRTRGAAIFGMPVLTILTDLFYYVHMVRDCVGKKISMRPVKRPDDEPFLVRLFFELRLEDPNWKGLDDHQRNMLLEMQYKAQDLQYSSMYPGAEHHVIEIAGNPVGRLLVNKSEYEDTCLDITILEEYRNQGIGTLILNDMVDESAQNGKVFSLSVVKTNPAAHLYRRLGLEIVQDEGVRWRMQRLAQ